MIELKAGTHKKAKWVIRHYREITQAVEHIERRRPKLVRRILMDEVTGLPKPLELQPLMRVSADKKIVITYVEGMMIKDIVSTVISERLSSSDSKIMTDLCVKGLSTQKAASDNGVSEITAKRARLRMEKAYLDEISDRESCEEMA